MNRHDRVLAQLGALHDLEVFSTAEARRAGVGPESLQRWVRDRLVVRVTHGWYVRARARTREDWQLCVLAAVLAAHGEDVVASHHSALALRRLPVHGAPDLVHVTHRRRTRMRYTDRYVVHAADAISRATSGPVVPVAVAVVQCGIAFGPVSMLVAGDAALMSGVTDRAEIASIIEVYAHSPGMAAVREAFPVLDPRSESVGESLLRYALHLLGRPVETQYRPAQGGRRCDMRLLGTPLILEFDGMAKFTTDRSLTTMGATRAAVSSAVTSVFERDEELGAQGLHVIHVTWHQLLEADGTLRTTALDRRIRTRLAAIAAAPTLEPTARAGSVSW